MEIFDGKGVRSAGVKDPEKRRSKESRAEDDGREAGCVDIDVDCVDGVASPSGCQFGPHLAMCHAVVADLKGVVFTLAKLMPPDLRQRP